MKLFIDNDIILDLLLKRKDFQYAYKLLALVEKGKIKAFTSPVIFTNSFYVISKLKNKKAAWNALQKLRVLLEIISIDQKIIDYALTSEFTDFEDAVEYYSAIQKGVDILVTRNKKHYSKVKDIAILSAAETLVLLKKQEIL